MEIELANKDLFETMSSIFPKILEPKQVRMLFQQITSALDFIHTKNIQHNDIKLENIFVFENSKIAKLADFGFSTDTISDD